MKLEELIQKRFVSTATLVERLTTYNGVPAVFSPEAPGDEQEGWGGETQYPMVTYNYDLQANEERNSAGSLSVSIFCQNTTDVFPEDIAPIVKECLRDVILLPEGGTEEELESIDVLNGITDVYPPVFCMTSVADHQKAQAPALVQKLMENNVPFVYRVFGDKVNKLGHVFHCDVKTIDAAQCNDAECDFFREFCF